MSMWKLCDPQSALSKCQQFCHYLLSYERRRLSSEISRPFLVLLSSLRHIMWRNSTWGRQTNAPLHQQQSSQKNELRTGPSRPNQGTNLENRTVKTVPGIGTMETKNQRCFCRKLAPWVRTRGLPSPAELLPNPSVAVQSWYDIGQITYRPRIFIFPHYRMGMIITGSVSEVAVRFK